MIRRLVAGFSVLSYAVADASSEAPVSYDLCVYGGTPAGLVAAVTAKQEGLSVVVVEPSRWVGGILSAGLKPKNDCPEPRAVGGLTKSIVFELGDDPAPLRTGFRQWIEREKIPVVYEHRLRAISKSANRIATVELEWAPPDARAIPAPVAGTGRGRTIKARMYIDASYEGDLMAAAGVRYATGREARNVYNEAPAGVNAPTNWTAIDPYASPGNPSSGLLPLVDPDHGKTLGEGDEYTQAYNFRFYVTRDAERRKPLVPAADYSPAQFELVGRFVEHLKREYAGNAAELMKRLSWIFPGWRNQRDYNYQRNSLVTIAPLGVSRYYQDGDWATRSKIWRQHVDYLSGLHHFLCTDPRVPAEFRESTAGLGLDGTMHDDTEGWPTQLYVRISRRMQSDYIITLDDVLNRTAVKDSVGLALYGVDTYPVRRYAARHPETGKLGVATEGNMWIGGARGTGKPYGIPYRAIVPGNGQCGNLLVPVCFSASYIAYASARMEPVFCVLGESAAVAAAQALRSDRAVQDVDIHALRAKLTQRGQVLEWVHGAIPEKKKKS